MKTAFTYLAIFLLLLNFIGTIGTLFVSEQKERILNKWCLWIVSIASILVICSLFIHLYTGFESYDLLLFEILNYEHYRFTIHLLWDLTTWTFLITGSVITLFILYFSGYYMHREEGFGRFFTILMFFYGAYNLTVLAGNFTTLFIGWEFLGLSSFLLIGFYRGRYLPVRNALKVFSVYRIGDVGLILGMWALHHLFHEEVVFIELGPAMLETLQTAYLKVGWIVGLGFLLAAMGKSAIFPFSYWLPRALEGPTSSSAIFYGALSVHLGILLLLRTFYVWYASDELKVIVILIGFITYFTANKSAKLQSSIKAQIAYSSIAQIGIMCIELGFGLKWLVLAHFISNAFLRTYQLLVSPSIAAYLIRQQVFYSKLAKINKHLIHFLPERWYFTLFILSQNEWYLDYFFSKYVFQTFKTIGKGMKWLQGTSFFLVILVLLVLSWIVHEYKWQIPHFSEKVYSVFLSYVALLLIIRAFVERFHPLWVIYYIFLSEGFILLSVSYNQHFDIGLMLLYLSGIIVGFLGLYVSLKYLKKSEPYHFHLHQYQGHVSEYPKLSLIVLISVLCMIGFPISPTFLAEDMIIGHIYPYQVLLIVNFSLHYVLMGITGIKLFSRLFLGPSCKTTKVQAFKYS